MKKQIIAASLAMLLSAGMYASVSAETIQGTVSDGYNWTIDGDELTLNGIKNKWSLEIKDGNCYISGDKIESFDAESIDHDDEKYIFSEKNKPFMEWAMSHSSKSVTINIGELNVRLGEDLLTKAASKVIIGSDVQTMSKNSLSGLQNLSEVYVYNSEVDLKDTGLGFDINDSKMNDVVIYGHAGSKAELYASENGFNFVSLDDYCVHVNAIGDINVDENIDVLDLSYLSLYLIGDYSFEEFQKKLADIDNDGTVTLADLARLRQYISKKIEVL